MTDRTRSLEWKVGGLILTAVALLVLFLVLLGDFRCEKRVPVTVDFPTSADLKVGAPVKVSGVTVGKVTRVDLWGGRPDPDRGNRPVGVRVTLAIDADAAAMLRQDALFRLTTLGILGEKYVEVSPGSLESPTVPAEFVFVGKGPMNLDAVGSDAGSLVADLSSFLAENRENLRESIANIRQVTARANEILEESRPVIQRTLARLDQISAGVAQETRNGATVGEAIVAVRDLARSLDRGIGPVLEALPGTVQEVRRLATDGSQMARELAALVVAARPDLLALVVQIRGIVQGIAEGKGTVGGLLVDREIYDDLVALMKDIKRHPWRLLLKD